MAGANFLNADLWKANLASANIAGADFSSAHLRVAKLPVDVKIAKFCHAVMPDGATNTTDC